MVVRTNFSSHNQAAIKPCNHRTMTKYLRLEDITAYQIASELADYVWKIVSKWEWFAKRTIGIQFVEAADSTSHLTI